MSRVVVVVVGRLVYKSVCALCGPGGVGMEGVWFGWAGDRKYFYFISYHLNLLNSQTKQPTCVCLIISLKSNHYQE